MSRLPATRRNLQQAFDKHKACYDSLKGNHDRSRRLILFYAVETGLKVFLLDKIGKYSVEDLIHHHEYSYLKDNGHDIMRMLKSASIDGQYKLKTLQCENSIQVEPHQYHQLWRYGLDVANGSDEQHAESVLCGVVDFLSPEIAKKKKNRS
jgi:hypothetical protein